MFSQFMDTSMSPASSLHPASPCEIKREKVRGWRMFMRFSKGFSWSVIKNNAAEWKEERRPRLLGQIPVDAFVLNWRPRAPWEAQRETRPYKVFIRHCKEIAFQYEMPIRKRMVRIPAHATYIFEMYKMNRRIKLDKPNRILYTADAE